MTHMTNDTRRQGRSSRQEFGGPIASVEDTRNMRGQAARLLDQVQSTLAHPIRPADLQEVIQEAQSLIRRFDNGMGRRGEDAVAIREQISLLLGQIRSTLVYAVRSEEMRQTMQDAEALLRQHADRRVSQQAM